MNKKKEEENKKTKYPLRSTPAGVRDICDSKSRFLNVSRRITLQLSRLYFSGTHI